MVRFVSTLVLLNMLGGAANRTMARKKSVRRSEVLSPSLTHLFISTWNTKMNQHDQYHKIHWIIGGPYHNRKPTHTHYSTNDPKPSKVRIYTYIKSTQMTQNHLKPISIHRKIGKIRVPSRIGPVSRPIFFRAPGLLLTNQSGGRSCSGSPTAWSAPKGHWTMAGPAIHMGGFICFYDIALTLLVLSREWMGMGEWCTSK